MIACNARNLSGSQQPQLCTDVNGTFQYGAVITLDWDVVVYKFNASTKAQVANSGRLSLLTGNPLFLPINNIDVHYTIYCHIDGDGYIWVGGNTHTEPLRLIRSTNPNDVSAWTTMYTGTNYPFLNSGANSAEYNIWNRTSDGTSLWFFSQPESPTNSRGRDWLAMMLPPGFGTTWLKVLGPIAKIAAASDGVDVTALPSTLTFDRNTATAGFTGSGDFRVKTTTGVARISYTNRAGNTLTGCTRVSGTGLLHTGYIAGAGPDMQNAGMGGAGEFAFTNADTPQGVTADRVYILGVVVSPANLALGIPERVHVWGIWRTEDADAGTTTSSQQPWYLYCDVANLGMPNAWKTASGVAQAMPIGWSNRASAQITTAPNYSIDQGCFIGLDELEQPYIVLENETTNLKTDPGVGTYVVCWYSRALAAWQVFSIPNQNVGASNGPKLIRFGRDQFLITQSGSRRVRVRSNRGQAGGTTFVIGPPIGDGTNTTPAGTKENAEANPDPIAWRTKRTIEFLLPDGDTPTIAVIGGQSQRYTKNWKMVPLHHGSETTSGSAAAVDNVIATSNGAVLFLAVESITATNITVTVEHSANGTTWSTLDTFTLATAAGGEHRDIAAGVTINEFLRVTWTITGVGSVKFLVSAARL